MPIPTCSGKELMQEAIAAGVQVEDTCARLSFGGREGVRWRIDSEDVHGDNAQARLEDDCRPDPSGHESGRFGA